jgi:benzoate transport
MSIREAIDSSPISRFQVRVIGICLILNLIDGFDVLVIAFAASGVAKEFGLNGAQIGLLLSSGAVGMALGSAFIAPLADRIGRRPLSLVCLVTSTLGMTLAATSTGFVELGLCRLLTGLGVGGLIASLPVIIAEYSPARRRGTTIGLYTTGLPLGGVLGGAVAVLVTVEFGWRASFAAGAVLTALMLITAYVAMPESLDYLLVRQPAHALDKINQVLRKMRLANLDVLPEPEVRAARGVRTAILTGRQGVRSILLWIAFFIMMGGFYFATGWTPRLLEQSGLSAQQGISGGVLLNLGGVVATLAFSVLALAVTTRLLTVLSLAAAGVSFLMVSLAFGNLPATLIAAIAVGAFINASATGLFAIAPGLYPARVRTTAVGWAAAFGRLGAIVSPILAGVLVDRAWTPSQLFILFAVPMIIAAAAVAALTRTRSRSSASPARAGTSAPQPST